VTEAQFQKQVVDLAHLKGWKVAHFRSVPVKRGSRVTYQTPVGADGKGFPDLVLVRDRVVFAELKVGTSLRPDQKTWIGLLGEASAEVHVWRPRDLDRIKEVLS